MHRILTIECDVSSDSRVVSSLKARTKDSNANKIAVLFKQNAITPYSGYDGFTLTIRYKLPNKTIVEDTVAIFGDSAETLIRNDVFSIAGLVEVELKISDTNFVVTASENAYFEVVAVMEGEDVPPHTAYGMGDLSDVVITDPQNGDLLVYEDGYWVNKSSALGSVVVTSEDEPAVTVDYWFDIE